MSTKGKEEKPLTMAAMAAELGLSRAAVSSVVNGGNSRDSVRVRVSPATVQRVTEHLARRGYVPSRAACNLRASPERVVGVLYVGSLNSHLIEAFHRLVATLAVSGPGLEVMVAPLEKLEYALRELLARRVTDLVWMQNPFMGIGCRDEHIVNHLIRGRRTVIYNYMFNTWPGEQELIERGVSLVGVDRPAQYRRMALFLKRLGHKVVAFPDVGSVGLAADVYSRAGLIVADCQPPFHAAKLIHAMKHQGVTAAWFNGDIAACDAIDALRACGVRIPEDLTLMGFDGMARAYRKDLTTLVMPVEGMVSKVCEIVAGTEPELRHCFDMELVKGETHGRPAVKSKHA